LIIIVWITERSEEGRREEEEKGEREVKLRKLSLSFLGCFDSVCFVWIEWKYLTVR